MAMDQYLDIVNHRFQVRSIKRPRHNIEITVKPPEETAERDLLAKKKKAEEGTNAPSDEGAENQTPKIQENGELSGRKDLENLRDRIEMLREREMREKVERELRGRIEIELWGVIEKEMRQKMEKELKEKIKQARDIMEKEMMEKLEKMRVFMEWTARDEVKRQLTGFKEKIEKEVMEKMEIRDRNVAASVLLSL